MFQLIIYFEFKRKLLTEFQVLWFIPKYSVCFEVLSQISGGVFRIEFGAI